MGALCKYIHFAGRRQSFSTHPCQYHRRGCFHVLSLEHVEGGHSDPSNPPGRAWQLVHARRSTSLGLLQARLDRAHPCWRCRNKPRCCSTAGVRLVNGAACRFSVWWCLWCVWWCPAGDRGDVRPELCMCLHVLDEEVGYGLETPPRHQRHEVQGVYCLSRPWSNAANKKRYELRYYQACGDIMTSNISFAFRLLMHQASFSSTSKYVRILLQVRIVTNFHVRF